MSVTSQYIDKHASFQNLQRELEKLYQHYHAWLHDPNKQVFWQNLHQAIANHSDNSEKQQLMRAETELLNASDYLKEWIDMAVDSPERFEFFIQTKAAEIQGESALSDYYWALRIRIDQLTALVHVYRTLIDYLEQWSQLSPQTVLDDAVFLGLSCQSIKDQVYLEATRLSKDATDI